MFVPWGSNFFCASTLASSAAAAAAVDMLQRRRLSSWTKRFFLPGSNRFPVVFHNEHPKKASETLGLNHIDSMQTQVTRAPARKFPARRLEFQLVRADERARAEKVKAFRQVNAEELENGDYLLSGPSGNVGVRAGWATGGSR